jgi:hypothetical protein
MRKGIVFGALAILFVAFPSHASPLGKRYIEYPRQSKPMPPAYLTLAEGCSMSLVQRLTAAKWIDMGASPGRLLFLQWEFDETTPPMVSVCAYSRDSQGRHRVMIPEVRLFYGHYRMYEVTNYRFLFVNVDGDDDIELVVFSDNDRGHEPGFYLEEIYDYSKDHGLFMQCDGFQKNRYPEKGFDSKNLPDRSFWGCRIGRKAGNYVEIH